MITTTREFTRSRDIRQTSLRSVGIAAVFLSVLAATATGVAVVAAALVARLGIGS